jgi:multiple sugar transport system permease protein
MKGWRVQGIVGAARHGPLAAAAVFFAGPLVWMLLSSLKPQEELTSDPFRLLPGEWRWANYADAVTTIPFARHLANSLFLCAGSVAGTLLSCTLAAYGFARLKWPGRDVAFAVLIATMLLPWQATMIPRFFLIKELGLYNTLAALIVPTFFGDAFSIFRLRQFFKGVPEELSEAARLDGAGELSICFTIVAPLARPALATVALFAFIAAWNDFNGPLLYLSDPALFPLSYGLEQFVSAHHSQTSLLLAAAVLFTLPIVAAFLLAQRTFVRGIATTGLK